MDWLIPFLCGMGAAVISAWGVGGGTLLLLVMTLFLGVDQRTAQGINLLFFLPTALSALICHWKNGCLDRPTLKNAVSAAVPAAPGFILFGRRRNPAACNLFTAFYIWFTGRFSTPPGPPWCSDILVSHG